MPMFPCLLLVGSLLVAQAETPTHVELKTDVRRLVRQLDSPELADREAAEAELLRRGPAILGLLPKSNDSDSAEVRQRLGRVRQRLQQAAAEAVTRSSTITLRANDMPLSRVLSIFEQQSGNRIVDARQKRGQPVADPKLSVVFDKTPFWPALDRVLDQAGLIVYPFSDNAAIEVMAKSDGKQAARYGRVSYVGPFRIEATQIQARRDLRGGEGILVVNVEAAWEPRLRVIGLMQRMADVKATDERGRNLPVADAQAQLEIPTGGDSSAVKFDLRLQRPSRQAERIASIKGRLTAMIPGRIETFRFAKLAGAKDIEQRIAGAVVTLEEVRKNNESWEVRVLVRFDDAGDALASHRTWIFSNPAYLEGPDGKPIAYNTFETTRQGRNEVGVAYFFSPGLPLEKLAFVYKTPGLIITREFDYELKDLRLP
jgi:hypothetical protein